MISGVPIVPEHIWSKVKDPTTFTNAEDPVGTGPMKVKSFNPQQLVIERNPDYWQADKVKVQEIRFHKADAGGQVEQLKLSRGEYDQQRDVRARTSRRPTSTATRSTTTTGTRPAASISVYMNLTKAPFDDVEFRKALTTAFDHHEVIEQGAARLRRRRPARPAW